MFIYIGTYRVSSKTGYDFTIEKIEGNTLVSKLFAERIKWNEETEKWTAYNYYIRDFEGDNEKLTYGNSLDTTIYIHPDDFTQRDNVVETMNFSQLNEFIALQKMQGSTNVAQLLIEKNKRIAFPFSAFILTLIGVSVSSRKVRGGIGGHIAYGLAVVFGYIVFLQFSSQYAIKGTLSPAIAAWLPNVVFAIIAYFLYKMAPK